MHDVIIPEDHRLKFLHFHNVHRITSEQQHTFHCITSNSGSFYDNSEKKNHTHTHTHKHTRARARTHTHTHTHHAALNKEGITSIQLVGILMPEI